MRHVNWWLIGCAVTTIAIAATLGKIWSLPGLAAVGAGWGVFIGGEIREAKQRAAKNESPTDQPAWLDPVLAFLITRALLAIGLSVGVVIAVIGGTSDSVRAPLLTARALSVAAVMITVALLLRPRPANSAPS